MTFASFHVLEWDFWTKEKNNNYATLSIVFLHQNNNNNKNLLTYGINIILQIGHWCINQSSSISHRPITLLKNQPFTHQRYKFKSGTIQGELHLCTWFWLLAQQLSYWSRSAEDYNTDGASWHQRVWDSIWHEGLTYTKLLLSRSFSGGHNCTGKRWVFWDILAKYFDLS